MLRTPPAVILVALMAIAVCVSSAVTYLVCTHGTQETAGSFTNPFEESFGEDARTFWEENEEEALWFTLSQAWTDDPEVESEAWEILRVIAYEEGHLTEDEHVLVCYYLGSILAFERRLSISRYGVAPAQPFKWDTVATFYLRSPIAVEDGVYLMTMAGIPAVFVDRYRESKVSLGLTSTEADAARSKADQLSMLLKTSRVNELWEIGDEGPDNEK